MPQLSPDNYARVASIVTHATLTNTVDNSYPDLSPQERRQLVADIVDLMARRSGLSTHAVPTMQEDDGE